jgi:hypothetical protein
MVNQTKLYKDKACKKCELPEILATMRVETVRSVMES